MNNSDDKLDFYYVTSCLSLMRMRVDLPFFILALADQSQ